MSSKRRINYLRKVPTRWQRIYRPIKLWLEWVFTNKWIRKKWGGKVSYVVKIEEDDDEIIGI
jgi:hypothetical protein